MKKISIILLAVLALSGVANFSNAKSTKPKAKFSKAVIKPKKPIFLLSCSTCTFPNDYSVHIQYNPSTYAILNVDVYDSSNNLIASDADFVFSTPTQTSNGYTFSNFYVKVGGVMVNSSGEYRR
ncbi:MAG: hypothetical protein V4520_03790 [Bacteroidota bacterium]